MRPEGRLIKLIEVTNRTKVFRLRKYEKGYFKNVSIPKNMGYEVGDMVFTEINRAGDRVFIQPQPPCDECDTGMFDCDEEFICPVCNHRMSFEEI